MIRWVLELIVTLLVLSMLRSVIGILARGFGDMLHPSAANPGRGSDSKARRPTVEAGGELKRDPVCGTFISTATALHKKSGGETYYFCSPECRAKFRG